MEKITQSDFDALAERIFEKHGRKCEWTSDEFTRFRIFTEFLLTENEKYNLTAIRDIEGTVEKHLFDSFVISEVIPQGSRVVDVGSGAGFPSLPLAITRPDLMITALDSTEKKVNFIKQAAILTNSRNLTAFFGRSEELGGKNGEFREKFDVCVARSVASLPVLAELCIPLVRKDGIFVAMKSSRAEHEIAEAENAVTVLGGSKPEKVSFYELDGESRDAYIIRKISKTPPAYPRKFGQIKKNPL